MKLPKTDADAASPPTPPPKTIWDKVITSTPVVMTVLATVLAGLSSSEMSQAQYYRSTSAQHQSKASDQWAFFQAKKARATAAKYAQMGLEATGKTAPLTADALSAASLQALVAEPGIGAALAVKLDAFDPKPIPDDAVRRAVDALRRNSTDTVDPSFFIPVKDDALHTALQVAEENAAVAESTSEAVGKSLDRVDAAINQLASAAVKRPGAASAPSSAPTVTHRATDRNVPEEIRQLATDLAATRFRFDAARLAREAETNQMIAYLYDVAVMKTTIESTRHMTRSRYFFVGMLAAQAATVMSTLALAAREKSTLWTLAAGIGVLAMAYAAYVYLFT